MRRNTQERGAALVELALVLPVLLLLLGGVVDFGAAYRMKQSLDAASRNAARVATGASDDQWIEYSDLLALRSIYESLSSDSSSRDLISGDLTSVSSSARVIIFEPTADGQMNAGCVSGARTRASRCNVYSLADVVDAQRFFGADGRPITTPGAANNYLQSDLYQTKTNCASVCFRPATRNVGQYDSTGRRRYTSVGVQISMQRDGFFGGIVPHSAKSLRAQSVFAMERGETSRPYDDPSPTTPPAPPPTTANTTSGGSNGGNQSGGNQGNVPPPLNFGVAPPS